MHQFVTSSTAGEQQLEEQPQQTMKQDPVTQGVEADEVAAFMEKGASLEQAEVAPSHSLYFIIFFLIYHCIL